MAIVRQGSRSFPVWNALASQVHPVFMLPPVASSAFGALLAPTVSLPVAVTHAVAIFFAVYTAHIKDGYVDFHVRGEDEDHPLTVQGCRLALVGSSIGFGVCLAALWTLVGPTAALITFPGWLLGFLHAPHLDMNPVTATTGYPLGIAIALFGGFYVQTLAVAATPIAFAVVFWILLSGIKIIDDETDYAYDRSIDKRTAAVTLGRKPARTLATFLIFLSLVAVLWFTADGLFPRSAPIAALAFAAVVVVARDAPPDLATKLLVRGAYVFLAVLVASVWYTPLASAPLPDVGSLGSYTYLVTELLFGAIAIVLLTSAGREALRSAGLTIAVIYPIAYAWDWYSLEVGVFTVPLRTGVEFAGIPLEEHLFMIVVPGFVLGVHETLRQRESSS